MIISKGGLNFMEDDNEFFEFENDKEATKQAMSDWFDYMRELTNRKQELGPGFESLHTERK